MKELVMEVTREMPDNATIEEIFDAIMVRLSIMRGMNDIKNNNVISHEEMLKEIEEWR